MEIVFHGDTVDIRATRHEVAELARCFAIDGAVLPGQIDKSYFGEIYLKAVRFKVEEGARLRVAVKDGEATISARKYTLDFYSREFDEFGRTGAVNTDYHVTYNEGDPLFERDSMSFVIDLVEDGK